MFKVDSHGLMPVGIYSARTASERGRLTRLCRVGGRREPLDIDKRNAPTLSDFKNLENREVPVKDLLVPSVVRK